MNSVLDIIFKQVTTRSGATGAALFGRSNDLCAHYLS